MSTDSQPAKRPETEEQWHAKFLTDSIDSIAVGLRTLAERVERLRVDVPMVGGPGRATYAQIAAQVVHEITWGVANLHIERPIGEAAAADVARAKGE